MIDRKRFALNRIAAPALRLEEFYRLAADAGMARVELRNDLPGARVIDGLKPAQAVQAAERCGVEVITINALQKFNVRALRARVMAELEELLDLAAAIRCPALVLCPNNDARDGRRAEERMAETVDALQAFGPLFTQRDLLGYVEPLGFAISSLASVVTAADAIRRSGHPCYRVLFDTFHHDLGPDSEATIGSAYPVSLTGLIHVSGVEDAIPKAQYLDAHRLLPSAADRTGAREQVIRHLRLGYAGDISFEPFSPAVQRLAPAELVSALRASVAWLSG